MTLQLDNQLKFGVQTIHRRTEPAMGSWLPEAEDGRTMVEMIDGLGYDSLWVGDHLSFAIPILDPFIQLAQAATYSPWLELGIGVYLLPLRHPGPVAKQAVTLDHLSGGRFILGVGVGGEFETDFQVAGGNRSERGARLTEGIEVLRKLWSGKAVSHEGKYFSFPELTMSPSARQAGGPPIWCGGRSKSALYRAGKMADGWLSYVVTPQMYKESLDRIHDAASDEASRPFSTGHLLFATVDDTYEGALDKAAETLSVRYAMDFREPAKKYCALGRPQDVAERLLEFHEAGVRHIIMDFVGPYEDRNKQFIRFAEEVLPLMKDLR